MLVRLRARPANLLNGAKFFSISISISSCRLLTFCGCYSSCFCQCCCCCWCVCVFAGYLLLLSALCELPNICIRTQLVAFCVYCLLLVAARIENAEHFRRFFQYFLWVAQRSAALPQRADRAVSQVSWPGELCTLPSLSLSFTNRLLSVCYANGNSNELPTIWTRMSNALANKNSGRGHALLFLFGLAAGLGLVCTADIFGQVCAALKRKNHSKNCKRWKKMSTNSLRIRRVVQSNDQLWQNMPGKCV